MYLLSTCLTFACHVHPLHCALLVHLLFTFIMCGCYISVVLVQIIQIPMFVCMIIFARFQAFAAIRYQPSRLSCPTVALFPAWPLFNTCCPWMTGGGKSLTSCHFATLWVHTSSNSAPLCVYQSLFFWAFLLDILTPKDGTDTPYQKVGTKEPMPCSNPDEQRFHCFNAWEVQHFNLMYYVDILDMSSLFDVITLVIT
jgi:hypothetical protein